MPDNRSTHVCSQTRWAANFQKARDRSSAATYDMAGWYKYKFGFSFFNWRAWLECLFLGNKSRFFFIDSRQTVTIEKGHRGKKKKKNQERQSHTRRVSLIVWSLRVCVCINKRNGFLFQWNICAHTVAAASVGWEIYDSYATRRPTTERSRQLATEWWWYAYSPVHHTHIT